MWQYLWRLFPSQADVRSIGRLCHRRTFGHVQVQAFLSSAPRRGGGKKSIRINALVRELLDTHNVSAGHIDSFVKKQGKDLDLNAMGTLIHGASKQRVNLLPATLHELYKRCGQCIKDGYDRPKSITVMKLFQGLRNQSALSSSFILEKLAIVAEKCEQEYDTITIGQCLYVFKGISKLKSKPQNDKAIRKIFEVLHPKINKSKQELSGQAISNALYGLQGMSREGEERGGV